jgi:2-polyprenyl-3-methyl-5-hydroxy-6-metoxy-1,4-benzoquinol methylase
MAADLHEQVETSSRNVAEFYDGLASSYDAMTGFEKRFGQEEAAFRQLVEQYSIRTALDAGCGTGFHSLILSRLGVRVTGVDVSSEMLEQAKNHARALGLNAQFVRSTFENLGENVSERFDGVFCLGNSLPHVLSREELQRTLGGFHRLLNPRGVLIIQMLNYDRIMTRRERVQSVKEESGTIFVRFYDFEDELLRFNILRLKRTHSGFIPELDSIALRPVVRGELSNLLAEAGFVEVNVHGSIALEEFDPQASKDLVVVATHGVD